MIPKDQLLNFDASGIRKIWEYEVLESRRQVEKDAVTCVCRGGVGSRYPVRGEMVRGHRYWVSFCRRFLVSRVVQ